MAQASRSVLELKSSNCHPGPSERNGTGFLWGRPDEVVTALHVVSGCQQFRIHSEAAGDATDSVHVVRIFKRADLALLKIQPGFFLPPLVASPEPPKVNQDLVALGYSIGQPSLSSTTLKRSFGKSPLRSLLSPKVYDEILEAGTPSLSLEVLRLQGHLRPGLSGAPIIDRSGRIVAVGDGGLERGTTEISWGIPVDNLTDLAVSGDAMTSVVASASQFFAADIGAQQGHTITCGNLEFTQLRSRRFAELRRSTDDPQGTDVVKGVVEAAGLNVSDMVFDIYVHLDSGATIVVPAGEIPSSKGGDCIIETTQFPIPHGLSEGRLEMRITARLSADYASASEQFKKRMMSKPPPLLHWVDLSDVQPAKRFDGLIAKRESYGTISAFRVSSAGSLVVATLGRDRVFLGVAVLHYSVGPWSGSVVRFTCGGKNWAQDWAQDMSDEDCEHIRQLAADWVPMVISAFLTTFPIG